MIKTIRDTMIIVFLLLISTTIAAKNETINNDNNYQIWGPLLEEWATENHREKRVMKLPSTEEIAIVKGNVQESKIQPGKIINNKFPPPQRQITETDLHLLNAMEKLVYRVDFMEKRLRKVEEMLYYVMAGNRMDQDSCPINFTRVGAKCYLFKYDAGREMDWKAASKHCQKMGSVLAEMETIEENQDIVTFIQASSHLKGKDFWTGGLNPGLLWIWSNSARPVPTKKGSHNNNRPESILGDGRCLRLWYDPRLKSYSYRGTDCGARYSYICELVERKSDNEISRLGKSKNIFD